jgi:hypothetical protein
MSDCWLPQLLARVKKLDLPSLKQLSLSFLGTGYQQWWVVADKVGDGSTERSTWATRITDCRGHPVETAFL